MISLYGCISLTHASSCTHVFDLYPIAATGLQVSLAFPILALISMIMYYL